MAQRLNHGEDLNYLENNQPQSISNSNLCSTAEVPKKKYHPNFVRVRFDLDVDAYHFSKK